MANYRTSFSHQPERRSDRFSSVVDPSLNATYSASQVSAGGHLDQREITTPSFTTRNIDAQTLQFNNAHPPLHHFARAGSLDNFEADRLANRQDWLERKVDNLTRRIQEVELELQGWRLRPKVPTPDEIAAMSQVVRAAVRRAYGNEDPTAVTYVPAEERDTLSWTNNATGQTVTYPVMRWDLSQPFSSDINRAETKKVNEILQYKKESLPLEGTAWDKVLDYEAYQEEWTNRLKLYFTQLRRSANERRVELAKENGEELNEQDSRIDSQKTHRGTYSKIDSKMDTIQHRIAERRPLTAFAGSNYDVLDSKWALPELILWTKDDKYQYSWPRLDGTYSNRYISVFKAIANVKAPPTARQLKKFGLTPWSSQNDDPLPEAHPHLPKQPENYHLAPQRWMFDPAYLARHPEVAEQVAPVDEPTPVAEIFDTDWCKARRRNYSGKGHNGRSKRKRLNSDTSDEDTAFRVVPGPSTSVMRVTRTPADSSHRFEEPEDIEDGDEQGLAL